MNERVRTALQEIFNLTQRKGYVRSEQINEIAGRALAERNTVPIINTHNGFSFETWWDAYGKKVGKVAARKTWCKLSKDQILSAVDDIVNKKRPQNDPAWTVADGRYQPNASTYLANHRWEDEWQKSTEPQVKFV